MCISIVSSFHTIHGNWMPVEVWGWNKGALAPSKGHDQSFWLCGLVIACILEVEFSLATLLPPYACLVSMDKLNEKGCVPHLKWQKLPHVTYENWYGFILWVHSQVILGMLLRSKYVIFNAEESQFKIKTGRGEIQIRRKIWKLCIHSVPYKVWK